MPKIKITEVDNTGNLQLNPITNVVYIPGAANAKTEPLFCSSVGELDAYKTSKSLTDDLSFNLARRLLQLGMQVIYQGFEVSEGNIAIDSDDWDKLADKSLYDIRFLTTGAYPSASEDAIDIVKCATKRGDCVALIDHPKSYNTSEVAQIRGYFNTFSAEAEANKGKFAAGFTPWFKSEDTELGGSKTAPAEIPASFGYLLAYARSIQSNPDWYAVAGTFRGNIPELSDVAREYTSAEIEILQARGASEEVDLDNASDNIGFAVNPIAYVRGYGYLVWGNRTLTINADLDQDSAGGDLKASAFLNVRNICIDIVKTLYAAARRYTFEQNSDTLWLNFRHEVQPLLDRMVSGNGIESYTMVKLATPKKARLKARISIVPIEGVEDFELELYLEDSLEVVE